VGLGMCIIITIYLNYLNQTLIPCLLFDTDGMKRSKIFKFLASDAVGQQIEDPELVMLDKIVLKFEK